MARSLDFTQLQLSLLSPCSIDPWPRTPSECPCANTKLLSILHHLAVQVCLPTAALQPFITNTAQTTCFTKSKYELAAHYAFQIIQGTDTERETALFTL